MGKIILNKETPTKYLFSQEKQKQTKKHIPHPQIVCVKILQTANCIINNLFRIFNYN